MSGRRYTEEFKIAAVRQMVESGHSVAEVAERLGVSAHSLYAWKRQFGPDAPAHRQRMSEQAELRRLRKENERLVAECDILKKAEAYFASRPE